MDRAAVQIIARNIIYPYETDFSLLMDMAALPEADALLVVMALYQAAERRNRKAVRFLLHSLDRQGKMPPKGYVGALDRAERPRPAHAPRRNQERDERIRTAVAAIRPYVKSDRLAFGVIVEVVPEIASPDAVRKIVRK